MLDGYNGHWITMKSTIEANIICQKKAFDSCSFGMIPGYDRYCYDFNLDPNSNHNWMASQMYCQQYGMNLITFDYDIQDDLLNEYLINTNVFDSMDGNKSSIWLGYQETEINSQKFKRISDGKVIGIDDIYSGLPDGLNYNPNKLDCLYESICESANQCFGVSDRSKRWGTDDCEQHKLRHFYGCQIEKGKDLNVTFPKKEYCPNDWFLNGEHCYIRIKYDKMTFDEASEYCQNLYPNAKLPSIHSTFENDLLEQDMPNFFWIGFTNKDGGYKWTDGSSVSYTNWMYAPSENNKCARVQYGKWYDYDCDTKNTFSCKVEASENPIGTTPPPTTEPPSNCDGIGNWLENPDTKRCYQYVAIQDNWDNARAICKEFTHQKGDLVAINSFEESQFIQNFIESNNIEPDLWIGISNKNKQFGYEWSDESPVSYVNWEYPHPQPNKNLCGMLLNGYFSWFTIKCTNKRAFICEEPSKDYVAPPPPPPPQVNCPVGWKKKRNKCYYISTDFQHEPMNYSEASGICKGFDRQATLAIVLSRNENNFIKNSVESNKKYWFGATDVATEGTWVWADGTPIDYQGFTHWEVGYPKNDTESNCMMIDDKAANWKDSSCSNKFNFVCMKDLCKYSLDFIFIMNNSFFIFFRFLP